MLKKNFAMSAYKHTNTQTPKHTNIQTYTHTDKSGGIKESTREDVFILFPRDVSTTQNTNIHRFITFPGDTRYTWSSTSSRL